MSLLPNLGWSLYSVKMTILAGNSLLIWDRRLPENPCFIPNLFWIILCNDSALDSFTYGWKYILWGDFTDVARVRTWEKRNNENYLKTLCFDLSFGTSLLYGHNNSGWASNELLFICIILYGLHYCIVSFTKISRRDKFSKWQKVEITICKRMRLREIKDNNFGDGNKNVKNKLLWW